MSSGDEFDTKVRAPLWYAVYDAFGKETHSSMGGALWPRSYEILVEALKRRLGLWTLSQSRYGGDAIRAFIQSATKEHIVALIEEAEKVAEFSRLSQVELFKGRLDAVRTRADEITIRRSSEDNDERWFDTSQICLNGHIINRQADSHPEANLKHCKQCGAPTILKCSYCDVRIQGYKHIPRRSHVDESPRPNFCHECGKRYPWTDMTINAAEALISELEGLTDTEKTFLSGSIDEIIRDTPRTEASVVRIKKLLPKMGKEAAEALRRLFVDVASETAKKLLTPGP